MPKPTQEKRIYYGWIYVTKSPGYADHFSVQYRKPGNSESVTRSVGYGAQGAADAVDFFETERKLGHVLLEKTPIGLRVYTIEKEVGT